MFHHLPKLPPYGIYYISKGQQAQSIYALNLLQEQQVFDPYKGQTFFLDGFLECE